MASTSADDPDNLDKSFGSTEREVTSAPIGKESSTHPMEHEHRRTDHDRDQEAGSSSKEPEQPITDVDAMDLDVNASKSLDTDQTDSSSGFTSAFHLCKRRKSSPETNPWCRCGPFCIAIC